ncbi:MAG: hypothetical protein EPN98_21450 [Phenylobacterium sp.]|uniref:Mu-like prophage major head subunit gpT family protein n=1 Tax=Phenylobacterium sp. TaxID=1871053 RepID=UPI001202EBAE|nr:Mu-like prophage major head subunit gpT family protein [Phenylobacterium sp.]TAL29011.1 MAG: hypothetical protein EPN98_21450 [Phenylobacterium sp.]
MAASPLTPALLQAFFVQSETRFQKAYLDHLPYWDKFAEFVPSSTETTIHNWIAQMADMEEWVGEKTVRAIKARAYPITNKPFHHTYEVDRDKIADDQAGVYARAPEMQAEAGARWPEAVVTKQLLSGLTAVGYDGQPFFDANHPVDIDDPSLGVYSNYNTGSTLTATTYATAKAQMRSFKGEAGISLQLQPTILMVGPTLEKTAKEIVQATNITIPVRNVAGTEIVAAAAATNVWQGDTTLIVNERLIDDTAGAWYMFSTNRVKPLAFQQREAVHRIPLVNPSDPNVFNMRKFVFSIEARGAGGFTLPFTAIKNVP